MNPKATALMAVLLLSGCHHHYNTRSDSGLWDTDNCDHITNPLPPIQQVPEPGTLALFAIGLGLLARMRGIV